MSTIFGKGALKWINVNKPTEGGLFRAYWTPDGVNATLVEEEGIGLRYEWYYEDGGHRADGISRSWHNNGNLNQEITYKNGLMNGLTKFYSPLGDHTSECICKDGEFYEGTVTRYHESKEQHPIHNYLYSCIIKQMTYKNGIPVEFIRYSYDKEGNLQNINKLDPKKVASMT